MVKTPRSPLDSVHTDLPSTPTLMLETSLHPPKRTGFQFLTKPPPLHGGAEGFVRVCVRNSVVSCVRVGRRLVRIER